MKKLLIALILLLAVPVWAGPYIEYVTPAASETVAGTTERCTDAEMVAGTSTACAGTPANVKAKLGPQTDGGILIGAGQTAAIEATAAGATTEILVGGGAGAPPVWTTATGSGAPVRATSPDLVTPTITPPYVTVTTSAALTAAQVKGSIITNNGQTDDIMPVLPAAAAGLSTLVCLTTTVAKHFRMDANGSEVINFDGADEAAGDYIGVASAAKGNQIYFYTAPVGAGWQWFAVTVSGPWVAQ